MLCYKVGLQSDPMVYELISATRTVPSLEIQSATSTPKSRGKSLADKLSRDLLETTGYLGFISL